MWVAQEVQIDEEVDVIVSEWMGYMLLYEVWLAGTSNICSSTFLRGTCIA